MSWKVLASPGKRYGVGELCGWHLCCSAIPAALPRWCLLQTPALLACEKSILILNFLIPHIPTFLLFFSFKFGRKIFYVNFLSELEEYVKLEQLGIPSQVLKWECCLSPICLGLCERRLFWRNGKGKKRLFHSGSGFGGSGDKLAVVSLRAPSCVSFAPVPSSVLELKILLQWSTNPASPTHPSGAFCEVLTLTLTWSLRCASAVSGHPLCSLCTVPLVFGASQSCHNLSLTR